MTTPPDPNRPEENPWQTGSGSYPGYGSGNQDPAGHPGGEQQPQYGYGQQPQYGYGGQPEYGHGQEGYGGGPPQYGGYGGQGSYPGYAGGHGGYGGMPQHLPKGMAITTLVLGILGFLGSFTIILSWGGAILAIIAIILGILAIRKAGRGEAGGRGMAISGLVLGIFGLIIGVILTALLAKGISMFTDIAQDCSQYKGQPQRYQQCINDNLPNQQSLGVDSTVVLKKFDSALAAES